MGLFTKKEKVDNKIEAGNAYKLKIHPYKLVLVKSICDTGGGRYVTFEKIDGNEDKIPEVNFEYFAQPVDKKDFEIERLKYRINTIEEKLASTAAVSSYRKSKRKRGSK